MKNISLVELDAVNIGVLRHLYTGSFPEPEQREWSEIEQLVSGDRRFHFYSIVSEDNPDPVGMLTLWVLDVEGVGAPVAYVEHFAVDPHKRGGGIGAGVMTLLAARWPQIVLEVEPHGSTPEATRRIGFYERCGFQAQPQFSYTQPPYSPGLPPVPLMLMTTGLQQEMLPAVTRTLHREVYQCGTGNIC